MASCVMVRLGIAANVRPAGMQPRTQAYGKAMVADVVITLSRKAQEKSLGTGRMFVAKNRSGRDGLLFQVTIDTARSSIVVINETEQSLGDAVNESETNMKSMLRKKWNEVKNDKSK